MITSRAKRGLTLVEMLAVTAIIGLLIALLLPAVQSARESARRSSCSSNLRQVSQGVLGFEAAFGKFPALSHEWNLRDMLANAGLSTTDAGTATSKNWSRVGPLFHILPYMDELAVYDRSIDRWLTTDIYLSSTDAQPRAFLCPSDPVRPPWTFPPNLWASVGVTSYHVCHGDTFGGISADPRYPNRGVFRYGKVGPWGTPITVPEQKRITTTAHVLDGLTNTVMLGEVAIFDGTNRFPGGVGTTPAQLNQGSNFHGTGADLPTVCLAVVNGSGRYSDFPNDQPSSGAPGWRWWEGIERAIAFSTIAAPNKPRCGSNNGDLIVPASSHHAFGAFVSLCDGSVRWVGDDIDDTPVSPNFSVYPLNKRPTNFGVWGAFGTIAGGELMTHVW